MPIRIPKSALFEGARRVGDAAADYSGTALDGFPVQRMELPDGTVRDHADITPRNFLANLMDDEAGADEVIRRLEERNPANDLTAGVHHDGEFVKSVDRPVHVIAAPDGGTFDDATIGTYAPDGDRVDLDSDRIPGFSEPDMVRGTGHIPGDINTFEHEMIHALKGGDEPVEFGLDYRHPLRSLDEKAAMLDGTPLIDNPDVKLRDPLGYAQFDHMAGNNEELTNFLFHLKRLSELVHDEDFGVDRAASNRLGRTLMKEEVNFDPATGQYLDPEIAKEGFRQGETAHGYERMKDMLQQYYLNLPRGGFGRQRLRDLMHQMGLVGFAASLAESEENPLAGLLE